MLGRCTNTPQQESQDSNTYSAVSCLGRPVWSRLFWPLNYSPVSATPSAAPLQATKKPPVWRLADGRWYEDRELPSTSCIGGAARGRICDREFPPQVKHRYPLQTLCRHDDTRSCEPFLVCWENPTRFRDTCQIVFSVVTRMPVDQPRLASCYRASLSIPLLPTLANRRPPTICRSTEDRIDEAPRNGDRCIQRVVLQANLTRQLPERRRPDDGWCWQAR